jgi:hypothetical protein
MRLVKTREIYDLELYDLVSLLVNPHPSKK